MCAVAERVGSLRTCIRTSYSQRRKARLLITSQPTPEKRRGAYYTPRPFADFLVRWAVRSVLDRALDPACGEAVFLEAVIARLREFGHEPARNQVVGFELDGRAALEAQQAAPEAVVSRANFFEQPTTWQTIYTAQTAQEGGELQGQLTLRRCRSDRHHPG